MIEHRIMKGLTVRAEAADSDSEYIGTLEGYAVVFESDSLEFAGWEKPWVERVAKGAFKRTLEEQPDVKALWSHREDVILARTPATLSLEEDSHGLKVEIRLIDTQQNRDIMSSVRAGLVDAMSFGFTPQKVSWEDAGEREIRTLEDVDLFEVSPVVWPAYPATSITANRSARAAAEGPAEMNTIREERNKFFQAKAEAEAQSQSDLRIWEQRNRFRSLAPTY
jgi:HK97 family phage prohead protease